MSRTAYFTPASQLDEHGPFYSNEVLSEADTISLCVISYRNSVMVVNKLKEDKLDELKFEFYEHTKEWSLLDLFDD